MNRWPWRLTQLGATLGLQGIAGIGMLLMAGILCLTSLQPDTHEVARLKQQIANMRSHPQTSRHYAPGESLALFYDFFPLRETLSEQLRTVHSLAAEKQLVVERVDYKLSRVAGTPLWQYQMTLPLNTDYRTLRHYLADVLRLLPNAALESVELQRGDADAELLEEKISLVLFFKDPHLD